MKFLITGLGNPGAEYALNRHNIGFMALDALADAQGVSFASDRFGHTCTFRSKGRSFVLLKPNTYMNLSGKAVRHHLTDQKLEPVSLLVITDDIALPFGKLRMRGKGSDGGHNGLKSIQEVLGTDAWPRLRVGVGNEFPKGRQADYVLSDFPAEEMKDMPALLKRIGDAVISFGMQGLERTMGQVNGRD